MNDPGPGPSDLRDSLSRGNRRRERWHHQAHQRSKSNRSRSPLPHNWSEQNNNNNSRNWSAQSAKRPREHQSPSPPTKIFKGTSNRRNQQYRNFNNNFQNDDKGPATNKWGNKQQQRFMGFKLLEEISKSDSQDILVKINQKREGFFNLIKSHIEKPDMFVLITELMAKVSLSAFNGLKLEILQEICNSAYLGNFQKYIMDIPYMQDKTSNQLYWTKQEEFWANFVTFCESLVTLLPITTLQKCRSMIDDCSKLCLEKLAEKHTFKLSESCCSRLIQLRERLLLCEKEMNDTTHQKKSQTKQTDPPPQEFRQLSVIPDPEELLGRRPFLRPNVVEGGYDDKEHYLDVQYRLLREDCFGPLREGIRQYIAEPHKGKYDHIRVYNNVRFIGPYIPKSQDNLGSMVQMDINSKKWPKRINWDHSKRLLFGSLLLFTKDRCNTFIVATLLERNVQLLKYGQIAVSLVTAVDDDIYKDVPFVMIESEVYFEPYFQVLNALIAPDFPEHLAMEKYIVNVDPQSAPPAYLNAEKQYKVKTKEAHEEIVLKVLDVESWPDKKDLGFDESQYEAYKLALTHQFAVIQGPPGTGKTYLGVKVAETLLENLKAELQECQMLVICYTNHALDQFLEALLPVTNSVVRIGGRSRNEAMDKINLKTLRRNIESKTQQNFMMRSKKRNVKEAVHKLENALNCLETLTNGVLSYESVERLIPEVALLGQFYKRFGINVDDPLKYWLFQHCMSYSNSSRIKWDQIKREKYETLKNYDDDISKANEPVIDDFEDDDCEVFFEQQNIKASFTVNGAETQINHFINKYREVKSNQEQQTLEQAVEVLKREINLFKEMCKYRRREIRIVVHHWMNFNALSTEDRWSLYFRWANAVSNTIKIREKIPALQEELKKAINAYEESRMIVDLDLLKGTRVVGMTTSGAARLRKLLQSLGPPIVIIEEAAEVLEAHIVTSLTKDCQHLIMIGDHQQLRPSTSNMKLIRQYHTNVSLFERMISNGIHSRRLGVQHRMRPEIAALISPHIYPDLQNHPSVEDFPSVLGTTSNLFFFNHDFQEQDVVDDSSSRTNHREGDLVMALANYLMQQGYRPDDVTILTTYAGQMFYLRKQREQYLLLSQVKVTVVDNYQGEESKIILLSLVRNNPENNVGFLKIENRICVALSRAKEGFYIFGNIETLKANSELWKQISETLEVNGALGKTITLKCENHPDKTTIISTSEDFKKMPEGGCGVDCGFERRCGHKCTRTCHVFDREHVRIKCLQSCTKKCDLGHKCLQKCSETCKPCPQIVEKTLPCGHTKRIPCHVAIDDPNIKCSVILDVELGCGHKAKKECHEPIDDVRCSVLCEYRIEPCGHRCGRKCHVNDDPDHEEYVCRKPCAKAKKGCQADLIDDRGDHQCKRQCFETCNPCDVQVIKTNSSCGHSRRVMCSIDIDTIPCKSKCDRILPACNHKCPKKCGEECGDCIEKVSKVIPECKHKISIECCKEATRDLCKEKCERVLTCGHVCKDRCKRACDPKACVQLRKDKYEAPCGHNVMLPCNVYNEMTATGTWKAEVLLKYCTEPCGQVLACEHVCGDRCGACRQGRLHAPCSQTCNQLNICGHQCLEPCNQMCPPCNKPCEIVCACGVRCKSVCGAPCTPCVEKCRRRCGHGACSRRCGQPCSLAPCDEACALPLPCGHRCRGLCGEPCPDICNVCRPHTFPRDFLGDEYGETEKFIKLQDCPHTFEVDDMDSLIKSDPDQVKIPVCPLCRKPIINTYRYKDIINQMLKKEINPIKMRVYGTKKKIDEQKQTLSIKFGRYREIHRIILQENQHWKDAFNVLNTIVRSQKNVPLPKLEMQIQYLEILGMIGQCYQSYRNANLTNLQNEFMDIFNTLCSVLRNSVQKISRQQQKDIGNEIKRMNSIIQFSKILDHSMYTTAKDSLDVVEAVRLANETVLTWKRYEEENALTALRKLQDVVKVTGIAIKQERELVVKAIGLKAGHWYKCENGHFYCIGECGGAMQRSRCIECKAVIGGQSHLLEARNAHAPEMDGSRYAAWSEQYNNMANFNLDDFN